jgi:hypothetical protein
LSKELQQYDSGSVTSYQAWIGKYAGKSFNYFARHKIGKPIKYEFNSLGYRGPEHYSTPDISVFGSSFSFGVGIEFDQCWHQQLGTYFINCYAPAGFAVTNNDIIDHYYREKISTGIVILQLREFSYNTAPIHIPDNVNCFVVDSYLHNDLFGFDWPSFVDKSEDHTHPGPLTHTLWATKIKQTFNL